MRSELSWRHLYVGLFAEWLPPLRSGGGPLAGSGLHRGPRYGFFRGDDRPGALGFGTVHRIGKKTGGGPRIRHGVTGTQAWGKVTHLMPVAPAFKPKTHNGAAWNDTAMPKPQQQALTLGSVDLWR